MPSSGLIVLEEEQRGLWGVERLGLVLDKGHIRVQEAYLGGINLWLPVAPKWED